MEKIFWVMNGNLEEVNERLSRGGKVKQLFPIAEPIIADRYIEGRRIIDDDGYFVGDIFAYIIVEFDE